MPPLFPATLAFYAAACALYLAHLWSGGSGGVPNRGGSPAGSGSSDSRGVPDGVARAARTVLAIAWTCHALDIGWLCAHGQHPVVNAREALYFASWLMCGVYLAASFRFQIYVVGALVVPGMTVLDVAARLAPSTEAPRASSLLGSVHITLATAGVALFAVAAGGAVVYLLEERNLKKHRTGRLFRRGPALETLDTLNRRCILLGFPLFTFAMVTGAIWVMRLPNAHGLLTPQYAMSMATWLLYAGLLLARVIAGWRGRKAALVTIAGFATAMTVLLIYVLRGASGA